MLSKKNYRIEDLPVSVKALTKSEESTIEGGLGWAAVGAVAGGVGSFVMVVDAIVNGEDAWSSEVLSDALCKVTGQCEPEPEPIENSWDHPLSGVYQGS